MPAHLGIAASTSGSRAASRARLASASLASSSARSVSRALILPSCSSVSRRRRSFSLSKFRAPQPTAATTTQARPRTATPIVAPSLPPLVVQPLGPARRQGRHPGQDAVHEAVVEHLLLVEPLVAVAVQL